MRTLRAFVVMNFKSGTLFVYFSVLYVLGQLMTSTVPGAHTFTGFNTSSVIKIDKKGQLISVEKKAMHESMYVNRSGFFKTHLLQLKVSLSRICMNQDDVQSEHDDINVLKIEVHVCFLVRLQHLYTLLIQHILRVNSMCTSG